MIMGQIHAGTVHVCAKADQKFTFAVGISSYEPDMIMAETLFNKNGGVIVRENTVLTPKIIERLQDIGFNKIRVYYNPYNLPVSENLRRFEIRYTQNLFALKEMIRGLFHGGTASINKVDRVAESIVEMDTDNSYVLKHAIIDSLDEYLFTHCLNVGMLSMLIARWLKFDKEKAKLLVKAGLFHDIGKYKIAPYILNKQGPLLPKEYSKVKEHVAHGFAALKGITGINKDVCLGIVMHHEREDGSGYPRGLKGEDIHEFAKIIAVADVFDAMTSNRAYRPKIPPFDVFEHLEKENMNKFDTRVTLNFLENVSSYYIGDTFILNSGELCKIVFINPRQISRPLIKIGERYVDLTKDKDLKITSIL